MPGMSRPVQQQRRQVEYATKADVGILAAEVHGFRESTEAEIRGLREANEAQIRGLREANEAQIQGFRESTEARLNAHDQALERIERTLERIDKRFDDLNARHRATVRWIIGAALTLGGLILAALGFG